MLVVLLNSVVKVNDPMNKRDHCINYNLNMIDIKVSTICLYYWLSTHTWVSEIMGTQNLLVYINYHEEKKK